MFPNKITSFLFFMILLSYNKALPPPRALFKFNAVFSTSLFRYYNGVDHFYTTAAWELGGDIPGSKGKHGFTFEGYTGSCLTKPLRGAKPLHRYWNGVDHFYTLNAREIGTTKRGKIGKYRYRYEGVQCYCFSSPKPFKVLGLRPLYRYFNGKDHFYTMSPREIGTTKRGKKGKHGYRSEGVACWMWPY